MLNLVNVLDGINDIGQFCGEASAILRIVGWVYVGIEIVVPILLIFMGMFDLARAVSEKDEQAIKKAQQLLIKRAIAAALVFLVAALVGLIMRIIGGDAYKQCTTCIFTPWNGDCKSLNINGGVTVD